MKRIHVFIFGEIQGVGFRGFVNNVAYHYNLKGFVRNLRDNSVEVIFEGEKVDEAVNTIKKGFKGAKVTKIDVEEEPFKNEFDSFNVEPTP